MNLDVASSFLTEASPTVKCCFLLNMKVLCLRSSSQWRSDFQITC